MAIISTKKEVAKKIFGIDYNSLYRWCRYGVPKVRRQGVDNILCKVEIEEFGHIVEPNKELRLAFLSDPILFKRRISRLFPVFSEK